MAGKSICTAIGNIVRDPETREVGQTTVTKFTVAFTPHPKADTVFLDCECWGDNGVRIGEHLGGGEPIFVSGGLNVNNWEDKDGNKRSKVFLKVTDWSFTGGKKAERAPEPAGF